jgi:cyclopropane fatty-acyl-phospholipid synthase-like methyltransferase
MNYLILIIFIILIIEIRSYYYIILNKYFRSNNNIVYDYLIKYIQTVSKNNYYMNYGLWTDKSNTLIKANKNLCKFIFLKARLNDVDTFSILDVGCGYGTQDFNWIKKLGKNSYIHAVDISETQIKYANRLKKKWKRDKKIDIKNRLKFMVGDAHYLPYDKFNRIISLESAFHYKNRQLFFNNVFNLLEHGGIFIISDIILNINTNTNNNIFTNLFIQIASDFLCIPQTNLIGKNIWTNQITNTGLKIVELYDITDRTFIPYYKFFVYEYIKNKNLPEFMAAIIYNILNNIQPFSYIVAVCIK